MHGGVGRDGYCRGGGVPGRAVCGVFTLMLGAVAAMLLSACGEQMPSYRYRLTVVVDTPEGVRSGSSVIEVRTSESGGLHPGSIVSRFRGEAVAVDLGRRGTLFALLSARDHAHNAPRVAPSALLPSKGGGPGTWRDKLNALRNVRGSAPVPLDAYPMLVRFRDASRPGSVEEVRPADLQSAFGAGVRLRMISAEITEDDISTGIVARLPWWNDYRDRRLDGSVARIEHPDNPNLGHHLTRGFFSSEAAR